jgi:hypothetical protein
MGDRLPHGLGRSSHWREWPEEAGWGSISLQAWQQRHRIVATDLAEIIL